MNGRVVRSIGRTTIGVLVFGVIACGATQTAGSPPTSDAAAAALRDHKCAKCHARPEPGTRSREYLDAAFHRHRTRVHLTDDQWRALTDYLAAPP